MKILYSNPKNDILLYDILNDEMILYEDKNTFILGEFKLGELLTNVLNENYMYLCFHGTQNNASKEILKYKKEYETITGNKNFTLIEMLATDNAEVRRRYPFVYWIYDSIKKLDMDYYKCVVDRILLHQEYDATAQQRLFAFNMACEPSFKLEYNTSVSHTFSPAFQGIEYMQCLDNLSDCIIKYQSQSSEHKKYLDILDIKTNEKDIDKYNTKLRQHELSSDKKFKVVLDFVKSAYPDIRGVNYFEVNNYKDFLGHLIIMMIDCGYEVRKCLNCNKYFAPEKIDTEYCNISAPQDSRKTCSEYIKYKKYLLKTQTDESTKLYKQIYNSKLNKIKRRGESPGSDIKLCDFMKKADGYRKAIKSSDATEQEFIEWLNSSKTAKE